jgi:transcriptional regulator with AAA-type ATPase domain
MKQLPSNTHTHPRMQPVGPEMLERHRQLNEIMARRPVRIIALPPRRHREEARLAYLSHGIQRIKKRNDPTVLAKVEELDSQLEKFVKKAEDIEMRSSVSL